MKIRKAKLTDSQGINILSDELGYNGATQKIAENRLTAILDSNTDEIWVHEEDNQLKGWIHFLLPTGSLLLLLLKLVNWLYHPVFE